MKGPRAPAIPARSAAPYPRCVTRITRAPCSSAISIEPSVDPLSATTTSPLSPASWSAFLALSTQYASEFASLRHGIDRKSTRLNSSHSQISYAVFCLKKKNPSPKGGALRLAANSYLPAKGDPSVRLPGLLRGDLLLLENGRVTMVNGLPAPLLAVRA